MTSLKSSRKRIGQVLGLLALGLVFLVGSSERAFAPAPATLRVDARFALAPGSGPKGIAVSPESRPDDDDSGTTLAIANAGSNTLGIVTVSPDGIDNPTASVLVGSQPLSVDVGTVAVAASTANSGSQERGQPSQVRTAQAQQTRLLAFTANFGSNDVSVVEITRQGDKLEGKVVETIRVGRQPTSLDFDPNSNRLYVNNFGDSSVSVIEVKAPGSRVVATIRGFREPIFVKISPDGKRGYVSSQRIGEGVAVFDTATNTITQGIPLPDTELRRMALSLDGKRLYVAARTDSFVGTGQIVVIDTDKLEVAQRFPTEPFPLGLTVTPNGRCLFITHSVPNRVSLMDVTDGAYVIAQDPAAREPQDSVIIGNLALVTNFQSDNISVFQLGGESGDQCTKSE
jgi:DNA-binding beta-propeller fold protein YncE